MPENQNIEYKESWRDEFLKTICGFANSQGGKLYIGINDNGVVTGIKETKKLLEDIPNKIRSFMGILIDANLLIANGLEYIEIIVRVSEVAISYKGVYYYRTGSTTQELAGAHLADFIQKKSGKTWDDIIELRATIDDIDELTVKKFINEAKTNSRLPEDGSSTLPQFLEKLRLTDNGHIKRAAILLFGKDVRKFFPSAYLKIGRIGASESDLLYQEIIEKNIIETIDETINVLRSKFLVSPIKIENIRRVEMGEYPLVAIREMVMNALVHQKYTSAPIQIRVYDDRISIWNDGTLPEGITPHDLENPHSSRPRNPIIADACFKGGYIELWGSGTLRIIDTCKTYNLPKPQMKEYSGGFSITINKFFHDEKQLREMGLKDRQITAMLYLEKHPAITNSIYQDLCKVTRSVATKDLSNLVQRGLILPSGGKGTSSAYLLNKE